MSNDTTEKQLADLREQVAKIIANQGQLQELICVLGRHLYAKDPESGGVPQFERLAKPWQVKR